MELKEFIKMVGEALEDATPPDRMSQFYEVLMASCLMWVLKNWDRYVDDVNEANEEPLDAIGSALSKGALAELVAVMYDRIHRYDEPKAESKS